MLLAAGRRGAGAVLALLELLAEAAVPLVLQSRERGEQGAREWVHQKRAPDGAQHATLGPPG